MRIDYISLYKSIEKYMNEFKIYEYRVDNIIFDTNYVKIVLELNQKNIEFIIPNNNEEDFSGIIKKSIREMNLNKILK